jgi:Flp pilus assembly protein TadB|tara:strand:- start:134 stop:1159 length:1026 start_codon:yes stop_codon:yes gene_type:complete
MAFKIIFLEEFGKAFVPKGATPYLRKYLLKAGIKEVPYKYFGALFYLSAIITGMIYILFIFPILISYSPLILLVFSFLTWFITQISFAALFILLVYFYLDIKIFNRTRQMEEMLPDFLQAVSSNLKGGMSFENSLWGSIKPRFRILANEMSEVSKKVMTGYDVDKALLELSEKYDSPMLRRSMDLIMSEIKAGGNIAELIDKIVDNLKKTRLLKEDMSASAIAYIIFISVIVIVISPLLFSLSFHLLMVIINFIGKLSAATDRVQTLPFSFTKVIIEPSSFRTFSISAIALISIFSSMIVSIVEKGNVKAGLKYIPIYLFGSLTFYFIFMKILGAIFGNIA